MWLLCLNKEFILWFKLKWTSPITQLLALLYHLYLEIGSQTYNKQEIILSNNAWLDIHLIIMLIN